MSSGAERLWKDHAAAHYCRAGNTGSRRSVLFDGKDIVNEPVYLRRFGFMFQDYALFPHMSVAANVGFGLRMAQFGTRDASSSVWMRCWRL